MNIPEYLQKLCQLCGSNPEDVKVDLTEEENRIKVILQLPETDLSMFIGAKGETLDAIESLLRMVFQAEYPEKKLVFDIGGYKAQREEKLQAKAIQIAEQVLGTGKSYRFGYLNSYERYLVHSAIGADERFAGLETVSEDTEFGRVLILRPKDGQTQASNSLISDEIVTE
jgi:spoIIIJ-associated protein